MTSLQDRVTAGVGRTKRSAVPAAITVRRYRIHLAMINSTTMHAIASAVDMRLDDEMATSKICEHAEHITSFLQTIADKSCEKKLAGIAIGVVFDGEEFSACSGWADADSEKPVTKSTAFEIGSISKLFTSLLLAIAVKKQEVGLDAPVQEALGDVVTLPTDGKSQITYRSLANHRSSLPRLPKDLLQTADKENPYVHYDEAMLYACLNEMKTVRPIGSRACYSNFGVGLLGHVLGKLARSDYHTALRERVLVPLGMENTSSEVNDKQTLQLAAAHKKKDQPTEHWDFTEVTAAAGSIRSSLSDMFKFLRANIDPPSSNMANELLLMREPSDLPHYETKGLLGKYIGWIIPFGYVFALAIFVICMSGVDWLTDTGQDSLLCFSLMLLPTLVAAMRWGRYGGGVALTLVTCFVWKHWGFSVHSAVNLIWGLCLIYVFSNWSPSKFVALLRGDGRLAWQASTIDTLPMLWHNGMVGGAASYLGIVEDHQVGVVVLTNTAKSVDAIGVEILTELVRLNDDGCKSQENES